MSLYQFLFYTIGMQNNSLVTGVAILIIGLAVGYFVGVGQAPKAEVSSMHGAMGGMMMGLEGKTGDALDKAFLDEMIVHHEGAVEMAQALLRGTKRPELIKLGGDIITAQTGEIKMMQDWRTAWFGQ